MMIETDLINFSSNRFLEPTGTAQLG